MERGFVGDDEKVRALEVGAVEVSVDLLQVIHGMDLREKFTGSYEKASERCEGSGLARGWCSTTRRSKSLFARLRTTRPSEVSPCPSRNGPCVVAVARL
jgi:hypothetical protein